MIISLIVAASTNNAIGKGNKLLWSLPNDMRHFKNTTWAMPVVMGRKTFDSMGGKPLSGRKNIIITRQKDWKAEGVISASDLESAIAVAEKIDAKELFVIGGGEIYLQTLPLANTIYLTRVHAEILGDVFFPELDINLWKQVKNQFLSKDEKHAFDYSFQFWERIK
ncbi:MAG: dihydrofolate reductase [Chitinophagaceae bacterium]|nr:MAG: dihydrofolate reductase [Chitinophagaceae bacterium]